MIQTVRPVVMQEAWVQALGQEDPLRRNGSSPSILTLENSMYRVGLVGHTPWSSKESDKMEQLTCHIMVRGIKIN